MAEWVQLDDIGIKYWGIKAKQRIFFFRLHLFKFTVVKIAKII